MQSLKKIDIEYRFTALFGLGAFIVSIFTGIVSGIGPATVFIRSFIILPLFAIFGFAIIFVIRKYVPEFYEFLNGLQKDHAQEERNGAVENPEDAEIDSEPERQRNAGAVSEDIPEIGDRAIDDVQGSKGGVDEKQQGELFSELKGEDFPSMESITDSELEKPFDSDKRKLGKHIIIDEHFVKYEPRIMAEAVRTMMSKDED